MMILYLSSLIICGLWDLKDRAVPLWAIILVIITGIGMCVTHPVFSILSGVTVLIFCLTQKMGAADRILFPMAAAAIGMFGVLIGGVALAMAAYHGRRSPAPGVTYLAAVSIVVLMIGGFL